MLASGQHSFFLTQPKWHLPLLLSSQLFASWYHSTIQSKSFQEYWSIFWDHSHCSSSKMKQKGSIQPNVLEIGSFRPKFARHWM
jgi:hypothetical protein